MNVYSVDEPFKFEFAENCGEIVITGYHGELDYLIIPPQLDGRPVTAVSSLGSCVCGAYFPSGVREISPRTLLEISCAEISPKNPYFQIENNILYSSDMKTLFYCFDKNIRKLEMPRSIEVIRAYAFYECKKLKFNKDFFPRGLRCVGERAFCGCKDFLRRKKKRIKLPKGFERAGLEAFSLKKISGGFFGNSIYLYKNCIVFPKTTRKITGYTKYFGKLDLGCSLYFRAENGVVITADGKTAIGYCGEDSTRSVVIPDSVEIIDEYAFYCLSELRSVFFGSELREIRKNAFEFCKLSSLHIPEKLEFLGENALPLRCLKNVTADENNRFFHMDGSCLYYKNELLICFNERLEEYVVPDETETIRDGAFENCRLLSNLVLPKNLRSFSGMILPGCNNREAFRQLLEIDIPENIQEFSDESVNPVSLRFSENAATVFCRGGIVYRRTDKGLAAICAFNDSTEKTVLEKTVVIAENAFAGCDALTSVWLPDTLKRIEAGAFSCSGLQKLMLPDGVEFIGEDAFEDCPLGRVFIPRSVKHISASAFGHGTEYFEVSADNPWYSSEKGALYNKNKTVLLRVPVSCLRRKFTVPEGVIEIRGAFKFCERITKIVLPRSLEIIRSGAFYSMNNTPAVIFKNDTAQILEDIIKQPNACVMVAESGSSAEKFFLKYKKDTALNDIPCRIKFRTVKKRAAYKQACGFEVLFGNSGTAAISGLRNTAEELVIPEKAGDHTITEIISYAFAGSDFPKIISIADTVEKIGDGAFYRCGQLSDIRLPARLGEISERTFSECARLLRCVIPEGCKSIKPNAFQYCFNLSILGIPRSVEHISRRVFGEEAPLALTVYVERGSYAEDFFKGANKTKKSPKVVCVNSMSDIPDTTTYNLSDGFVYQISPDGSTKVLFGNVSQMTGAEEFTVPESINGHRVTSFDMYNTPTSIKILNISASIEDIRFGAAPGTERVFIDPSNKRYFSDGQAVYTKDKAVLLQFCDHIAERYTVCAETRKIADNAFRDIDALSEVVLPNGLEEIGCMAFRECTSIREMNIPDSVREIGENAFYWGYSSNLNKINIPKSLEIIRRGVLCVENSRLFIPKNVRSIDTNDMPASSEFIVSEDNPNFSSVDGCLYNKDKTELLKYYDAPARTEYAVPETVTAIGKNAFSFSQNVRRVILGESVKKIKKFAFHETYGLKYVNLEGVEKIGINAFDSSEIVSAELRCKKIPFGAFSHCKSLTKLKLTGTEKISHYAFERCSSLKTVALPETLRSIGCYSFGHCWFLENIVIPKSIEKIGRDAFLETVSVEFFDSLRLSPAKFLFSDIYLCDKTPQITVRSAKTGDILFRLPSIKEDSDLFYTLIECVGKRGRFKLYEIDDSFPAERDFSDTLTQLAVCRLLWQTDLTLPHHNMYLEWLKRHATEVVCRFIGLGDQVALGIPERIGLIEYGDREKILAAALASGRPEITARLLAFLEKKQPSHGVQDIPDLSGLDDASPWKASAASPTKAGCYPLSAPDAVFPIEIDGVKITGAAARGKDIPENYASITSLTIPEGYTSIGENAFFGCESLRSVSLPSTLKIIGDLAFGECGQLEEIIIPDGVLSIGNGAFSGCPRLEKIKLPAKLRQIGENAFDRLSRENIPEALEGLFQDEEYVI